MGIGCIAFRWYLPRALAFLRAAPATLTEARRGFRLHVIYEGLGSRIRLLQRITSHVISESMTEHPLMNPSTSTPPPHPATRIYHEQQLPRHLHLLAVFTFARFTMAALRTYGPSVQSIFRFAAQPSSTSRCAQCLKAQRCPFSSFRPRLQSHKRPLMTDSAYRPYSLPSEIPPPPRNTGVPETSIAGAEAQQNWPPSTPWQRQQEQGVGEREGEAQKSKPTVAGLPEVEAGKQFKATTTATAAQPAAPKKKSKLRPRKAPITITPTAVSHLRELLEQPESKLVRVGVKNRGCSGLAYHLEYVDKAGTFDESVQQDGVQVLIDSKALFSIIGSEMDWLEDKLSARFIFKNPNISKCSGDYCHRTSWILTIAQLSNVAAVNRSAFHEAFPRAIFNVYIDRTAAFSCILYVQAFRGRKKLHLMAVHEFRIPQARNQRPSHSE